jgi:hypothetical protein
MLPQINGVGSGGCAGTPGAKRRRVWIVRRVRIVGGRQGPFPNSSDLDKLMPRPIERMRWSAAVVVVMVVPSGGHIEAALVPMPVSLTDPNSDAADPDVGAFRNDQWLVANGQRTSKCRRRQKRNKKENKCSILHGTFSFVGTLAAPMLRRMRARYS